LPYAVLCNFVLNEIFTLKLNQKTLKKYEKRLDSLMKILYIIHIEINDINNVKMRIL